MTDASVPDRELTMAAIRQEFLEGLPARVDAIRTALAALPGNAGTLETLFMTAHSLKGTAAASGELEVSASAAAVEHRARVWTQTGIRPDELKAAAAEVDRLAQAVTAIGTRRPADPA